MKAMIAVRAPSGPFRRVLIVASAAGRLGGDK